MPGPRHSFFQKLKAKKDRVKGLLRGKNTKDTSKDGLRNENITPSPSVVQIYTVSA